MGVALFPVVEGYSKYYFYEDPNTDWKSLGKTSNLLDQVAAQLQVVPLTDFMGQPQEWFRAVQGLATVQKVAAHIQANPDLVGDEDYQRAVVNDLGRAVSILEKAQQENRGFRIDFIG